MTRRAGVLVPLFSIPSRRSWGIGEIGDIEPMTQWLAAAGQRILQLLPINEMPRHESSPYSALSAMAIDPQFVTMDHVEDFVESGGEAALAPADRATLEEVRSAPRIRYADVRRLKREGLARSFRRFDKVEFGKGTRREAAFKAFIAEQSWWLDDYALFSVLRTRYGRSWTSWPAPFRSRRADALAMARAELARPIRFRQYVQWLADDQWKTARGRAGGVALFGDLPFMVGVDSVDVWSHQDEFRLDASVGVPPDAFSETGQDWRLPLYRWDVLQQRDFDWLRHRAVRNAHLFDACRVDHLVGFYRTYFRPLDGSPPQFSPPDEPLQVALGEQVLRAFRESGPEIFAEDLGVVPDFVRASMVRLSIAGYKILRWERHWNTEGQPFSDPADYPALSVATSGTHDTESMATWWRELPIEQRRAVMNIPSVRDRLRVDDREDVEAPGLPPAIRTALLEALFASGSDSLILPIQDLFGWTDRINQPATISALNWTWRLPWLSDRLLVEEEPVAMAVRAAEWARRYQRQGDVRP